MRLNIHFYGDYHRDYNFKNWAGENLFESRKSLSIGLNYKSKLHKSEFYYMDEYGYYNGSNENLRYTESYLNIPVIYRLNNRGKIELYADFGIFYEFLVRNAVDGEKYDLNEWDNPKMFSSVLIQGLGGIIPVNDNIDITFGYKLDIEVIRKYRDDPKYYIAVSKHDLSFAITTGLNYKFK